MAQETAIQVKSKQRQLFELCETKAGDYPKAHVIPFEESFGEVTEFRIYHSDGYCFDIKKERACEPEDVGQFEDVDADGNYYSFYSQWDGFKSISVDEAINLTKSFE